MRGRRSARLLMLSAASLTLVGLASGPASADDYGPIPVSSDPGLGGRLGTVALWIAVAALFVGLALLLAVAFSAFGRSHRVSMHRRMSAYSVSDGAAAPEATPAGRSAVAQSAVELAGRVVRRRDLEGELAHRLDAAGIPLRAPEWAILHLSIALGAALLLALLTSGRVLPAVIGLVLGVVLPFTFLDWKASRRRAAFDSQLPDTLQLMAGSLQAGYSLPQAADTVVREGSDPIATEFNRALVEARLGVPLEDALEGVAERMESVDFGWVVMAIRIQREVGGNLAEVLLNVAATLRERERLRRQVRVLSAEGRLSAWILGLLPVLFALYLILARPEYLHPLYTTVIGWVMIAGAVGLLLVGVLWMRRVVKVEV